MFSDQVTYSSGWTIFILDFVFGAVVCVSFSVDPISSDGVTFSADVSDTVGFDVMESRCVSSDAICDALLLFIIVVNGSFAVQPELIVNNRIITMKKYITKYKNKGWGVENVWKNLWNIKRRKSSSCYQN